MNKVLLLLTLVLLNVSLVFSQDWQTDYSKAQELALNENKSIVLVFQGSDWCAPCMKLDREIWSTDDFTKYAKDHYVMLQADFPKRKKNTLTKAQSEANAQLAETYNKNGIFPFVVILNNKGDVLGQLGYEKTTPLAYIDKINSFVD